MCIFSLESQTVICSLWLTNEYLPAYAVANFHLINQQMIWNKGTENNSVMSMFCFYTKRRSLWSSFIIHKSYIGRTYHVRRPMIIYLILLSIFWPIRFSALSHIKPILHTLFNVIVFYIVAYIAFRSMVVK